MKNAEKRKYLHEGAEWRPIPGAGRDNVVILQNRGYEYIEAAVIGPDVGKALLLFKISDLLTWYEPVRHGTTESGDLW